MAFCTADSWRWKREGGPQRGSRQTRDAGNRNCQPHSVAALGYFLSSASGSITRPWPQIGLVQFSHPGKMPPKRIDDCARHHRRSVLLSFAAPDRDLVSIEIHILHPQLETLLQPKTRTVEQHADRPHRSVQTRQNTGKLLPAPNDGQTKRLFRPDDVLHLADRHLEYALVLEQQRRKRLILGRSAHVLFCRKPRQESGHVGCPQRGRVGHQIKRTVSANPADVGDFGTPAVMAHADRRSNTIEELWLRTGALRCLTHRRSSGITRRSPCQKRTGL